MVTRRIVGMTMPKGEEVKAKEIAICMLVSGKQKAFFEISTRKKSDVHATKRKWLGIYTYTYKQRK